MAEENADTPEGVQARATDYLSAAVEERAKARAAIAAGESPAAVVAGFKSPLGGRRGPTESMEAEEDDAGLKLRPTKGPVQPIPLADLLPPVRISAGQEEILSHLAPSAMDPSPMPMTPPSRSPAPEPAPPSPPENTRRTRAIEMPEPVEPAAPRRELRAPEWDRYYNPGLFATAKVPRLPIDRATPPPDAPAWELVGRTKARPTVPDARAPYRASLKEGAAVKNLKPERDVERFLAQRVPTPGVEVDLEGPARVPEDSPDDDEREAARKAEFEAALADLERSFREGEAHPPSAQPPQAPAPTRAPPPVVAEPVAPPRIRIAEPAPVVESHAPPPAHSIARSRGDQISEEDEMEFAPQDDEEPPLGRQPPPDRLAEQAAHRPLAHDVTGASLCPTCGRRVGPSNAVLVCTACGRVACASCGKFSAGQPTGQIYLYEYKFFFPLCQPCFEKHLTIQTNLARAKAYLSSGNMTYAYYHAQTALQTDAASPYVPVAKELLKQVEARRAQMQRADKEWEDARKKMMRGRTSVLK